MLSFIRVSYSWCLFLTLETQTKTMYFWFMCMGILPACMSVVYHVHAVSEEARKWYQIPWSWNSIWLWLLGITPSSSGSDFNLWAFCPAILYIIFWNRITSLNLKLKTAKGPDCHCPTPPGLGLQMHSSTPGFYVGAEDPNSGLSVYVAGTLSSELFLAPVLSVVNHFLMK